MRLKKTHLDDVERLRDDLRFAVKERKCQGYHDRNENAGWSGLGLGHRQAAGYPETRPNFTQLLDDAAAYTCRVYASSCLGILPACLISCLVYRLLLHWHVHVCSRASCEKMLLPCMLSCSNVLHLRPLT